MKTNRRLPHSIARYVVGRFKGIISSLTMITHCSQNVFAALGSDDEESGSRPVVKSNTSKTEPASTKNSTPVSTASRGGRGGERGVGRGSNGERGAGRGRGGRGRGGSSRGGYSNEDGIHLQKLHES